MGGWMGAGAPAYTPCLHTVQPAQPGQHASAGRAGGSGPHVPVPSTAHHPHQPAHASPSAAQLCRAGVYLRRKPKVCTHPPTHLHPPPASHPPCASTQTGVGRAGADLTRQPKVCNLERVPVHQQVLRLHVPALRLEPADKDLTLGTGRRCTAQASSAQLGAFQAGRAAVALPAHRQQAPFHLIE